ncbi:MAG: Na/Pi cotransporter family protein [Spirochaetes bacterium]|nr:Na/Pi cotransporter family protein [Spirochaetota bacterium]
MDMFYSILSLFVGCGVFLYGIAMFGTSVRKSTSGSARAMFDKIGENRVKTFGLGCFITAIIQSSTATAVMVVGLVSAGLLTVFQGTAIILGAHLGTTSTLFLVMLAAFRVRDFFMVLVFIGALMKLVSKDGKMQNLADFFVGFGILFVGLMLMGDVFRHNLELRGVFTDLFIRITNPALLILIGIVFTIIIQSSTATTAILLTLIIEGLLPFGSAMFIALGAHGGTSSTALLASIAANRDGKRVALTNCIFSLGGVIVFTSFLWPFKHIVLPWYADPETGLVRALWWQLPFFQVSYNLILGLIKIWIITPVIKLSYLILKDVPDDEKAFGPTHLNEQIIEENIDMALDMAKKEIIVGAELVQDMFGKTDKAFKAKDIKLINEISETDAKVDILYKAVIPYLAKVSTHELGEEESKRSINYLYIKNELESIGDVIEESIMPLAKVMAEKNLSFSEQGSAELTELHGKVMDNVNRVVTALKDENALLAKQVTDVYSEVDERRYQLSHIDRLQKGLKVSLETSSIHLDLVNYYARINGYLVFIAKRILWLTREQV